jgi:hypothetical protein
MCLLYVAQSRHSHIGHSQNAAQQTRATAAGPDDAASYLAVHVGHGSRGQQSGGRPASRTKEMAAMEFLVHCRAFRFVKVVLVLRVPTFGGLWSQWFYL